MSTPIPAEPRERLREQEPKPRRPRRPSPAFSQEPSVKLAARDEQVETPIPDWHRREESIFFRYVLAAFLVFILIAFALAKLVLR